jgi:hypothetical protein
MTTNLLHPVDPQDPADRDSRQTCAALKKPYAPPVLVEWGNVRNLTRGPIAGEEDMDFSGTGDV